MMLQFPEILYEISNRNILEYFENDTLKSIGGLILKHKSGTAGMQVSDLVSFVQDNEQRRIIASFVMDEEGWSFDVCIKSIEQFVSTQNRHNNTLLLEIAAAEKTQDDERINYLLMEKQTQVNLRQKQIQAEKKR
jgi:hypothetical protein